MTLQIFACSRTLVFPLQGVCVCLCSEIPSETGLSPEWHFAVLIKSLSLVMPASRKPRAPFLFVRGHTVVYIKKILGYLKNTLMF